MIGEQYTSKEPKVVYEDQDLIVLNKPAGLHSVRQKSSVSASLADWIVQKCAQQIQVGKVNEDAGLVQRLDFETSGLILVAKNNVIWEKLRGQLMQGEITKYYYCLVEGKIERDSIEVNSYIGSPYRNAKKVRVYKKKPARPHRVLAAKTIFEIQSETKYSKISLLKAHADTARRHQIRAHAADIGHALVGDSLYGSKLSLVGHYGAAFFLQASYLSFCHPSTGKKMEFGLDVPVEILDLLDVSF